MCGIIGCITKSPIPDESWSRACLLQHHRGPDGAGSASTRFGQLHLKLGHQRLSIIDLSDAGAQPMTHPITGSCLSFNGEIYNFVELREELNSSGINFVGDSDTAVLLYALEHWGVAETLSKLNGMWAFAWYSANEDCLYLSRDRFGEKPLYWSLDNGELFFSSEIKSILALTGKKYKINHRALVDYLGQSLIDVDAHSFFVGIEQVPASALMAIRRSDSGDVLVDVNKYWEIPNRSASSLDLDEFCFELRNVFIDSVRIRLRSDVPVGVLLSGGVDSSAISIAAKYSSNKSLKLNYISAVSDDPRFDESLYIDIMGGRLQTEIQKVKLDACPDYLFDLLEDVTWYQETPLGSFSNVAHYLLMEKAKSLGVTVILSGQGADELLCGYKKYAAFYLQSLFRKRSFLKMLNVFLGFLVNKTVFFQFNFAEAGRYLPKFFQAKRVSTLGSALLQKQQRKIGLEQSDTLRDRQIKDLFNYSVPALNHSEDRMSMACSREIRLPFLDYRLVELLMNSPDEFKLFNGWTKYCFRKAMSDLLPKEIVWRKDKQGFVNPQSEWLKSELRDKVMSDYFCSNSLIFKHNFVNRENLIRIYDQYCKQAPNRGRIWFKEIFAPIALEVWLRKFENHINFN